MTLFKWKLNRWQVAWNHEKTCYLVKFRFSEEKFCKNWKCLLVNFVHILWPSKRPLNFILFSKTNKMPICPCLEFAEWLLFLPGFLLVLFKKYTQKKCWTFKSLLSLTFCQWKNRVKAKRSDSPKTGLSCKNVQYVYIKTVWP